MATFKINGKNFATQSGTGEATIHSDVVFPSGHVLQVVYDESRETNTLNQTYTNYYEVSITLKSASSDVYGIFTWEYQISTLNEGHGLKVYRNNSATVTTSHTLVHSPTVTDGTGPLLGYENSYTYGTGTTNFKDTLSGFSVGNILYYGFFFRRRSTNATVNIPPSDSGQNGIFALTMMEVQK